MLTFTIDEPVFKTATLFVLGCSFRQFGAHMQRRFQCSVGDSVGQCGQMFTFRDQAPFRCVWTEHLSFPIVLHEVFHLVTRICEDKGIPIKAHNEHGESADEAAAYLFEFFATALEAKRIQWHKAIEPTAAPR